MHRREMLKMLAFAMAAGCGGNIQHLPRLPQDGGPIPTPTPNTTITSDQVFSNVSQVWKFVDAFGHHMTIESNPIGFAFGSSGNLAVWHYTKDFCAGYWNPATLEQCAISTTLPELYFVLRQDADKAWRCIGFTYVDYLGVKHKVQIFPQAGKALPYTIIPANSNSSDSLTGYDAIVETLDSGADLLDFSPLSGPVTFSATWQTLTRVENGMFISEQFEGCVHEIWSFGISNGLEKVIPVVGLGNNAACLTLDSQLTMNRIA